VLTEAWLKRDFEVPWTTTRHVFSVNHAFKGVIIDRPAASMFSVTGRTA